MTRSSKTEWKRYFDDRGVSADVSDGLLPYVHELSGNGLPVIFEFEHLAHLLGYTREFLASAIHATEWHYRHFTIKKRRGGRRTISAPYPALLDAQKWVNRHILRKLEVHPCAHGFVTGRSILTNASAHLNQACLLKMDLQDFFPSISFRQVMRVFRDCGYAKNVSYNLASLCCLNERLPQGAATSPGLSNVIAKRMDVRLAALADSLGLVYTRYADDLSISGDNISFKLVQYVTNIAEDCGFRVNEEKTFLSRNGGRRIVTGISVVNDTPRIPRDLKRKLRQEVHFIRQYGALGHMSKRRIRNPFYLESLYGKICFWLFVEPDDSFAQTSRSYLGELISELQ